MNKTRNLKKRKIKKTQRKYNDVTTHGARKTKQNQILKKRKISKTKRMHKSRSNQFGGDNDDDNELKKYYIEYMQQYKYIDDNKKYDLQAIRDSKEYNQLGEKGLQLVWEIIVENMAEVEEMERKQREQQEKCESAVNGIQKSYREKIQQLIDEMNTEIDMSNQQCQEKN